MTSPASLGSIVSPNAKKNTAANASRNGRTSRSMRSRDRALGQHEADHERADRIGDAELLGDPGGQHREPDEAHREQLVVGGRDEPADEPRAEPRDGGHHEQERERGRELPDRVERRCRLRRGPAASSAR